MRRLKICACPCVHVCRTQQVRGIMEENKRRLQERGEKLANLEQRTAQMQVTASCGFFLQCLGMEVLKSKVTMVGGCPPIPGM